MMASTAIRVLGIRLNWLQDKLEQMQAAGTMDKRVKREMTATKMAMEALWKDDMPTVTGGIVPPGLFGEKE